MATATKPRPTSPVHGTCGLSLRIDGTRYAVRAKRFADGVTVFSLRKPDGTAYSVDARPGDVVCSCKDALYRPDRPGGCKHARSLRTLGLID